MTRRRASRGPSTGRRSGTRTVRSPRSPATGTARRSAAHRRPSSSTSGGSSKEPRRPPATRRSWWASSEAATIDGMMWNGSSWGALPINRLGNGQRKLLVGLRRRLRVAEWRRGPGLERQQPGRRREASLQRVGRHRLEHARLDHRIRWRRAPADPDRLQPPHRRDGARGQRQQCRRLRAGVERLELEQRRTRSTPRAPARTINRASPSPTRRRAAMRWWCTARTATPTPTTASGTAPAGKAEQSVAAPSGVTSQATWTALGSDPTTDRLVLGVLTSGGTAADVWLSVWDGEFLGSVEPGGERCDRVDLPGHCGGLREPVR